MEPTAGNARGQEEHDSQEQQEQETIEVRHVSDFGKSSTRDREVGLKFWKWKLILKERKQSEV